VCELEEYDEEVWDLFSSDEEEESKEPKMTILDCEESKEPKIHRTVSDLPKKRRNTMQQSKEELQMAKNKS
jgi:hypothetical protein